MAVDKLLCDSANVGTNERKNSSTHTTLNAESIFDGDDGKIVPSLNIRKLN